MVNLYPKKPFGLRLNAIFPSFRTTSVMPESDSVLPRGVPVDFFDFVEELLRERSCPELAGVSVRCCFFFRPLVPSWPDR